MASQFRLSIEESRFFSKHKNRTDMSKDNYGPFQCCGSATNCPDPDPTLKPVHIRNSQIVSVHHRAAARLLKQF